MRTVVAKIIHYGWEAAEILWLFFEIHLLKIILIVAFSLAVYTVSLLHLLFVLLTVVSIVIRLV